MAIVVLDSVVDKLANFLIDLAHIVPALNGLSTMSSIVSLQINKSVEMMDAEI